MISRTAPEPEITEQRARRKQRRAIVLKVNGLGHVGECMGETHPTANARELEAGIAETIPPETGVRRELI